jgi:hypothetical protein
MALYGKMLNQPKKLNAYKSTAVIFSLSLPLALFVFTLLYLNSFWVHVMHILDDILWAFGECNMEKNSNPKAEPHGSLQSCTVRPRKGSRQCSIGWVGGLGDI